MLKNDKKFTKQQPIIYNRESEICFGREGVDEYWKRRKKRKSKFRSE